MAEGHHESKRLQLLYAKDTQPNQTCSEVRTFLLLYVTGVFLCIWGVLTRLDYTAKDKLFIGIGDTPQASSHGQLDSSGDTNCDASVRRDLHEKCHLKQTSDAVMQRFQSEIDECMKAKRVKS